MGTTVVYIHGNGNKAPHDVLKRQWDVALFGKDMGSASRMAYWAPLRYPRPLGDTEVDAVDALDPLDVLPASALESAVPPQVLPPEAFIAEVAGETGASVSVGLGQEGTQLPIGSADGDPLEEWLRAMTYTADALAEGESAVPPTSSPFEALPFPKVLRTKAFRALVKATFKDVHAYFFGGDKEKMRQVVREALTGLDGPVVVIGHSLGSVLAYDVLSEEGSTDLDVPLLLTVGSPLAVTEIQDLVEQPLRVPRCVAAWRNVSDARDLVALDHTIRPEYRPADRCTDLMVTNDSANHHGIREYLRTTPVRQPVLELFRARS